MTFDIDHVVNILVEEVRDYQVPVVDLIAVQTRDPFRILVATILSARTKDETTAKAASRLFKKVSDLDSLAILDEATIAKLIYPVGFYKNKAKYLKELRQDPG
jgi:endonuclease III